MWHVSKDSNKIKLCQTLFITLQSALSIVFDNIVINFFLFQQASLVFQSKYQWSSAMLLIYETSQMTEMTDLFVLCNIKQRQGKPEFKNGVRKPS